MSEQDDNRLENSVEEQGIVEPYKNPKEKLYDKIHLSVKQLDIIIAIIVAGLVIALTLGILTGNKII